MLDGTYYVRPGSTAQDRRHYVYTLAGNAANKVFFLAMPS
jgi:hypothetical protein